MTNSESENPVIPAPEPSRHRPRTNRDWWPNQLDLSVLHQNARSGEGPMGDGFRYRDAVATLDVDAVRHDLISTMTTSQDWWPADYGHYGPLFIRLTWHQAGTYRTEDGRGGGGDGAQRFAPLNSWPDNANLDKARRLLWPVKQRYGALLSWADLLVLAGNVALESMGFRTFGFGFGREDIWAPEEIFWGPEDAWLGDERTGADRALHEPLGAVQMGLIYVNPEGPGGEPNPVAAARDIRETFRRMAMNDEETVALIAGGHTFGKCHGAGDPSLVGPEPEACPVEHVGLGWRSSFGTGRGSDTITSGLEGAWTATPTTWDNQYLETLFGVDWELTTSPSGAHQWRPKGGARYDSVPDAHDPDRRHAPMMATTDLALRMDPVYEPIARQYLTDFGLFSEAFAKAWFKLLHRDMGPPTRLQGPWVPEPQIWQDPVPRAGKDLVSGVDVDELKRRVAESGLSVSQLVATAWAAAACYRDTDKRGGANGARIRLEPQVSWPVNDPKELAATLRRLDEIRTQFNQSDQGGRNPVSLADFIVLAGGVGIELGADRAGSPVTVPFRPGRTDATQESTDVASFSVLNPITDGFRNHIGTDDPIAPDQRLVDRANLLNLTVTQMVALVGGLRSLGVTTGGSLHGVLTDNVGTLSTDFFRNILDPDMEWTPHPSQTHIFEGRRWGGAEIRWTVTSIDLLLASNAELRGIAEVFASDGGEERFRHEFVPAWVKVMELDRFDLG